MLTPDYLKNVADDAINIYSKLEDSIIKDVVRRLKNTDFEMTESARFQIRIAQEAGLLYDDIIEKVAKYYIYKNHLENEYVRFDIIEIYIYKDKYTIKHIKQVR